MLAFTRSNSYKRRTGNSPWHIHPLVWGGVSAFAALFVTLLSIAVVAVAGTLFSIVAWSPRPGRHRSVPEVPGTTLGTAEGGLPPAPAVLTAWMPDPTGRNELRYFDGSAWTEHVANGGVISADKP
jgi:hypothetical protein